MYSVRSPPSSANHVQYWAGDAHSGNDHTRSPMLFMVQRQERNRGLSEKDRVRIARTRYAIKMPRTNAVMAESPAELELNGNSAYLHLPILSSTTRSLVRQQRLLARADNGGPAAGPRVRQWRTVASSRFDFMSPPR